MVRAYESGTGTDPQIAAQFEVGEASVRRWVRLHRRSADVSPTPKAHDGLRVLSYWPHDRYLELAPTHWLATRAQLDPIQLERPLSAITVAPPRSE